MTQTMMASLLLLAACSPAASPPAAATATATPKPTATPLMTTTATAVSILNDQESEAEVLNLLADNGGCELPCLWGIVPGQTTVNEALAFYRHLGWRFSSDYGYFETGKNYLSIPISISGGFNTEQESAFVKSIHLQIAGNGFFQSVQFFSIQNILEELGIPHEVRFWLYIEPNGYQPKNTGYLLFLYYRDQGILIVYPGYATKNGERYTLCPGDPNWGTNAYEQGSGNMSIYIKDSTKSLSPNEIVNPFWMLPEYPYYRPIEDALGTSLEEFRNTLVETDGKACFTTPIEYWNTQ